jgi:hypothetical protein
MAQTSVQKAALAAAGLALVGGAATVVDTSTAASATTPDTAAIQALTPVHKPAHKQAEKPAPAAKELRYQYESQPNFFYCGPASTRMALTATGHLLTQDEVAVALGTTQDGTPSAEDTTRVLNRVAGKGLYSTKSIRDAVATPAEMDRLQADVVNAVTHGRAVVANIKGTAVDTDGAVHSYEGGHYLTVVGYQDHGRTVKIADPANPAMAAYWMTTIDLAQWIASRGYSA